LGFAVRKQGKMRPNSGIPSERKPHLREAPSGHRRKGNLPTSGILVGEVQGKKAISVWKEVKYVPTSLLRGTEGKTIRAEGSSEDGETEINIGGSVYIIGLHGDA